MTSRRKLSPSGIETTLQPCIECWLETSRRKLSPSGIETNAGSDAAPQLTVLRGGNYPHRGLKPENPAMLAGVVDLRGGNYPHRGLKHCSISDSGLSEILRGGNYPHRGLKPSGSVCGRYLVRSSRRKLSPSGIETRLSTAGRRKSRRASRRKLSPSGIETMPVMAFQQAAQRLRGGNYPHRGLKLRLRAIPCSPVPSSRRKLSPSGIETG